MADSRGLTSIRDLYEYHWWANRRLFEVSADLGEEAAGRDVGKQFSYPTIRRMLAHLYGADSIWLDRWNGKAPTSIPGGDIATLAELRQRWDAQEREQRAFIDGLSASDLDRIVEYRNTEGKAFRLPLGPLLQHVANHATHHRSELATMITMLKNSPPDTGLATYQLIKTGQLSG
jgi:uncharacterized damage-inducible protein DinB